MVFLTHFTVIINIHSWLLISSPLMFFTLSGNNLKFQFFKCDNCELIRISHPSCRNYGKKDVMTRIFLTYGALSKGKSMVGSIHFVECDLHIT